MNASLSIETATQLAVFLANRPGALARVCEALAKAEINIHALATSDTVDHTVVRMVVSDPTKALMLLGEAGTLALETEVLMIETASQPGVLAKIAERLAEAEVNIEYAYLAGGREAEKGLIVLRPSDVEKAMRALQDLYPAQLGFERHLYHERDADLVGATAGRAVGRVPCMLRGESRSSCRSESHARVPRSLRR